MCHLLIFFFCASAAIADTDAEGMLWAAKLSHFQHQVTKKAQLSAVRISESNFDRHLFRVTDDSMPGAVFALTVPLNADISAKAANAVTLDHNGEASETQAVLEQTAQRLAAVGSSGTASREGTGEPQKFQLPDRTLPAACAQGAHVAGVGPEVVESLQFQGVALSRWLEGEPVKDEEMHDLHTLEAVTKSLREFHKEVQLPQSKDAEFHTPMLRATYHLETFSASLPQDLIADMQSVLPGANDSNRMLAGIAPAVALHGSPRAATFLHGGAVGTAGELQMIGFEHCHSGSALWDLAYLAASAGLSDKELLFAVERYGTQRLAEVNLPPLSAFSSRHAKRRLSKKDILRLINLMQAIHLVDWGILALVNSILPKTPADLAAKHKEAGKDYLKRAKQALESEPIRQTQAWLVEELASMKTEPERQDDEL